MQKGLYNLNVVIHLKESSMQSASMQPYIQAQHMHIHHTLSDLISVHICSTTRLSAEESQLHSDIKGILAAETSCDFSKFIITNKQHHKNNKKLGTVVIPN